MATLEVLSSVQVNNGVIQRWWERALSDYQTEHDHPEAKVIKKYITLSFGGQGYSPSVEEGDSFIARTLHSWDTSLIGAGQRVTSAVITLKQYKTYGSSTDLSGFSLVVQNGQPTYPHLPPVLGDYLYSHYSGNGGSIAAEDWVVFTDGREYMINLNASGLSWINMTGITKLVIRSDTDISSEDFGLNKQWRYWWNLLSKLTITYTPAIVIPTVTTDPATDVEAISATLNGTLDDDGGDTCDCGFEWGLTAAYGNTTPTQSKTTGQSFSWGISGLSPGTLYHFRAFATNAAGTSYGADRTFVTLAIVLPTITTDPATDVEPTSATENGTLDGDGGEACDCGFEWGLTAAYGNTTPTQSKTTGQSFSWSISGLSPSTLYHFRAFATNAAGTSYGVDRTFTTDALPPAVIAPDVTTNPATGII